MLPEWKRNDAQFGGERELKGNDGQYWGYSGRGMKHTKEAMYSERVVQGPHSKAGASSLQWAMTIATNKGHYNTNGEVEGPSAKG